VVDGATFEARFNHLRKVRQKHKGGTVERPFSRMHNFYVLERGDKWAKTGTLNAPTQFSLPGIPVPQVQLQTSTHIINYIHTHKRHERERRTSRSDGLIYFVFQARFFAPGRLHSRLQATKTITLIWLCLLEDLLLLPQLMTPKLPRAQV